MKRTLKRQFTAYLEREPRINPDSTVSMNLYFTRDELLRLASAILNRVNLDAEGGMSKTLFKLSFRKPVGNRKHWAVWVPTGTTPKN